MNKSIHSSMIHHTEAHKVCVCVYAKSAIVVMKVKAAIAKKSQQLALPVLSLVLLMMVVHYASAVLSSAHCAEMKKYYHEHWTECDNLCGRVEGKRERIIATEEWEKAVVKRQINMHTAAAWKVTWKG